MLHPALVAELLDAEVDVAAKRLGTRVAHITRNGTHVMCGLQSGAVIDVDGTRYDAEPYAVSIVNSDGDALAGEAWPPGLNHGEHPLLGRPFICIRGTFEYHSHPSHLEDQWDRYRGRIALADLLEHILRRTGA